MTTTEYFPITPFGQGTEEIEALGSVLCRMAKMHAVSVFALSTHLKRWWSLQHPDDDWDGRNAVNAMNPMFCGTGASVATYVNMLIEGAGCASIGRSTFQALRTVVSPYGHGVCRLGRAWCPACLEEASTRESTFYDRLVWAVPVITRCRIHRVALESLCPSCGAFQQHYHHLGRMDLCFKCKSSLRQLPSKWRPVLQPTLYESECLQLVEAISSNQLSAVIPDAYNIFLRQLVGTVSELRKAVGSQSHIAVVIRTSIARDTGRPKLATLLKRCALLGLNPANLIRDPVGAADSIDLLDLAHLDVPADKKPKRPEHLVDLAEEKLRAAMESRDYDSIPSLRRVATDLGVSKGFLNYRLTALCAAYGRHRRECGKLKYQESIDRATSFLLAGPVSDYPSPRFPSHDHLAAAAAKNAGVGVRIGRLAADAALKKHLGQQAYTRYRKANGLHVPRSRVAD